MITRKPQGASITNVGLNRLTGWIPHDLPFLVNCADAYIPRFDANGVLTRIDTYQVKEAPMAQPLWLFLFGRVDKHQLLALANFNHYQFNNLSMASDDLFPKGS